MKYKIFTALALAGSAMAELFGGWDKALQTLVLFMALDWTQEYVSQKIGVSCRTMGRIENGLASLDYERLLNLAEVFEVSVADILEAEWKTV